MPTLDDLGVSGVGFSEEGIAVEIGGDYFIPPIGGFGNPAHPWSYTFGRPAVDLDAHRNQAMLIVATVRDFLTGQTFRPHGPIGAREPTWRWVGAQVVIYPAATIARSSANDDIPAGTFVPDLMEPSLNFGRTLFAGADPSISAGSAAGIVDLVDPRGDLDYLLDYIWDGAKIIIKRGFASANFSTWASVGVFTGSVIIGGQDKKQIRLRDLGWRLTSNLHEEYYTGAGGLNGDAALSGVWKPYCVGWCFNVEPVPIDGANQIWQWSFTPSEEIVQLRHGGSVLVNSGDYPDYETLVAAVVPSGEYATCLALSLVKVNITLTFGVRLDVKGDNSTVIGFPTPLTRAAIARRVVTAFGNNRLNPNGELDGASFEAVEIAHTATLGYYWKNPISKANALAEVMAGVLGWGYVRPNGLLSIGYLRQPSVTNAIQRIAYQTEGMGLIEIVDTSIPRQATHIGWRRNYGVQSPDQLAGITAEIDKAIYGNEARFAVAGNVSITTLYPTAQVVTIFGGFWNEADAQLEADRQQTLLGQQRRRYRWTMEIDPFSDLIDAVCTITNVNRLGFGAAKHLLCVGMDTAGIGETTTEWWG